MKTFKEVINEIKDQIIYIFQLETDDVELKDKTYVEDESIDKLLIKAKKIVKKYPEIKGKKYNIWKNIKNERGKYDIKLLKQDIIKN